jgi:hypothetical protein
MPTASYWVAYAAGSIVYTVELTGPPGSVSEEQAESVARAQYDRITGE